MGFDLLKYETGAVRSAINMRLSYRVCIILVIIMAVLWLSSGIWQWQLKQSAAIVEAEAADLVQNETIKEDSAYGEYLQGVHEQSSNVVIDRLELSEKGLMIQATADRWQEAANFGGRLKGLTGTQSVQIVHGEALTVLLDGQPQNTIVFTILLQMNGGAGDES